MVIVKKKKLPDAAFWKESWRKDGVLSWNRDGSVCIGLSTIIENSLLKNMKKFKGKKVCRNALVRLVLL
ncbi:hypothetical protein TNCT_431471 [Trichonephila clavata]|uniref:Uncharacterized protein n=1 Tax=Trichonephila clavata TaxID=2740835 RepID=A0A8X6F0C5_TRICU|nr:hypothetical protein TNCT_431471 [Trichonephila clavata]